MSVVSAAAIMLNSRSHGEHGAVVRLLTRKHGLIAAYVAGARSRTLRPVVLPGNLVAATIRARTAGQLPGAVVELIASRAPLHREPLAAAAIGWACGLAAGALPDGVPFPPVFDGLAAMLDAVAVAPSARGWGAALARYELLMLAELGFGLALGRCIVTGATADLAYISPRSGAAVSAAAARGHERQLLPLPPFLADGAARPADTAEVLAGLRVTGAFLARHVLADRRDDLAGARARLIAGLDRAVAPAGGAD